MADSYLNKTGLSYFWDKIKAALGLKVNQTDFDALKRINRTLVPETEIADNKNLNTTEFLSIGKYYVSSNAHAATLTNSPTSGKAFTMEVLSPIQTTIDNETTGTQVYRLRIITTYEGKQWTQQVHSENTAGSFTYSGWQYITNSGDVNNQIYANTNSKYGKVQITTYTADDGKWAKIASMSHHTRSNDNVNYTFRLDFTGSGTTQYRQSYTFGVGARMSNTALNSVRFDYLDSEKFNFNGAPELKDLVKVTRKWVAGTSSTDHYIYFEIWVNFNSGWKTYWLHPTDRNYRNDYSNTQAFFRNNDEWTYSSISGTNANIGQATYLTEGYEEVPMVDARKGVSYLDPIYTTRQTTADAPEINGRGGIRTFVATSSMSDRPEGLDGNILHLDWDNTGGFDTQLIVTHRDGTASPRIYARGMNNGTWGNWVRFIREQDLEAAMDELAGEKVSYKRSYTTVTTVSYKKITIQGGTYATDGAGALIFTREERFMVDGMCASGYGGRLLELGTSHNLSEPTTSNRWVKLKVYGVPESRTTEIYCKMSPYTYVDVHSSGTITIEDSTQEEYTNANSNATYIPLDPNNTYWANVKISNTSATNTTPTFGNIALTSSYPQIKGNGTLYFSSDTSWGEGNRGTLILQNGACRPSSSQNGTMDLGASNAHWRNLYLNGAINKGNNTISLPSKNGTLAVTGDIPTNTSDLTNNGSDGNSTYVEADDLATVATTGSYNDLTNKPAEAITIFYWVAPDANNKVYIYKDRNRTTQATFEEFKEAVLNSNVRLYQEYDADTFWVSDVELVDTWVDGYIFFKVANDKWWQEYSWYDDDTEAEYTGNTTYTTQANWNISDSSNPAYIWNKPTIPTKASDLTSDVGGNSYTGTCSTAAATAAKEITISADQNFVLNKGTVIGVKFTYTNTAQNPTLNINGTGAKSIWFNTAVITTGSLNRGGYANRYTYYIYDGTYWVWLNWGTDDNTTYSTMSVAEGQAGTATSQRVVRADYLKQIIQSYVPTTYAGSLITDGSITFDKTASGEFLKLETSTTDPGEGSVLNDNTLLAVYDVPDDYRRGEVLVLTQNVDTLATTSNVAAIWSAGTWTQFGRMASSSNKHILTIENPTSNAWVVEISLDCPSVLPGSVISGSSVITTTPATGIAELDSNNEISKVITWTRIASRGSVYNRKYVTIPANTTKKFCACVCTYQTSSNPTGTWEGGDEISGTAVGAGFGGASCTLTATLIDNGE